MIAKFSGYNSHTNGRSVIDSDGFYGQVFLTRDAEHAPRNREHWFCETVRTGDIAEDVHFNAGVVRPIRKLEPELDRRLDQLVQAHGFLDRRGRVCTLARQSRRALVAEPGLIPYIADAIALMDLTQIPARGIETIRLNVGTMFSIKSCIGTYPIGKDAPALFAFLRGYPFPVRVIEQRAEATNVLQLGISFQGAGRWRDAPNKTWGLQWVVTGDMIMQAEPTETIDARQFRFSLDFWRRNARAYRENLMGVAFDSTWEEVLRLSRDREDPGSESDHPAPTSSSNEPGDGALIP